MTDRPTVRDAVRHAWLAGLLDERGGESRLAERLGVTRANVNHHMGVLREDEALAALRLPPPVDYSRVVAAAAAYAAGEGRPAAVREEVLAAVWQMDVVYRTASGAHRSLCVHGLGDELLRELLHRVQVFDPSAEEVIVGGPLLILGAHPARAQFEIIDLEEGGVTWLCPTCRRDRSQGRPHATVERAVTAARRPRLVAPAPGVAVVTSFGTPTARTALRGNAIEAHSWAQDVSSGTGALCRRTLSLTRWGSRWAGRSGRFGETQCCVGTSPWQVRECTTLAACRGPVRRDVRARASTATAVGCLAAPYHAARDTSARRCHV